MASICFTCKETITANYVRIGRNPLWIFHKDHFVCSNENCGKNLKGGKVQLKDDLFYCPECYNTLFIQNCSACGEKIQSAMIKAFGNFYHRDHFVCFTCKTAFAKLNGKYYEGPDKHPYCEDHNPNFSECSLESCDRRVSPQQTVKAGGSVFHRGCLTCYHCKKPVGEVDGVFTKQNKYWCGTHYYELFVPRCTSCGDFINSNSLSANEENYHEKCLKCGICGTHLERYISVAGVLRCDDHLEDQMEPVKCDVCDKLITDEVIPAIGKKVHRGCFKCQFCGKDLHKATCKLKDNKLSCPECLGIGATVSVSKSEVPDVTVPTINASSEKPIATPITPHDDSEQLAKMKKEKADAEKKWEEEKAEMMKMFQEQAAKMKKEKADAEKEKADAEKEKAEKEKEPKSRENRITADTNWTRGDLIGKGGFGKVFQCFESDTGFLMAVKQVTVDDDTAAEIKNEIDMMKLLKHRNIVELFGTQKDGDTLNIFMEYVPGKSLYTTYTRFGAFKETVIQRYTKQLFEALHYCHERNVVHRDIKGRNILVNVEGVLKLADFGSAKKFETADAAAAPSMTFQYTPVWTAPEVLKCGAYGTKIDIWSAGCVIIEMGSAQMPWSEVEFENPFRALFHIGNSTVGPKVPEKLSANAKNFAELCLTIDPKNRPDAKTLLKHVWLNTTPKSNNKKTKTKTATSTTSTTSTLDKTV